MSYLWGVIHEGKAHDSIHCARDAAIELPRNSPVFTPSFEKRVRDGEVEVSFDQKTNQLRMTFKRTSAAALMGGGGEAARERLRARLARKRTGRAW